MLEIGWGKLVLIGIVALIVIGPKELPAVLRTLGQWMTKLRRMASEFQTQFQEAMREAEMADLKKQVDEITGKAQNYASFDPLADVRSEFETSQRQIENAVGGGPSSSSEDISQSASGSPATRPADDESTSANSVAKAAASLAPETGPAPIEPGTTDRVDKKAEGKPA